MSESLYQGGLQSQTPTRGLLTVTIRIIGQGKHIAKTATNLQ